MASAGSPCALKGELFLMKILIVEHRCLNSTKAKLATAWLRDMQQSHRFVLLWRIENKRDEKRSVSLQWTVLPPSVKILKLTASKKKVRNTLESILGRLFCVAHEVRQIFPIYFRLFFLQSVNLLFTVCLNTKEQTQKYRKETLHW